MVDMIGELALSLTEEDTLPEPILAFAKDYEWNLFGMYAVQKHVKPDGTVIGYVFEYMGPTQGGHQLWPIGTKTTVPPTTEMGVGDFDDITPEKIMTIVVPA
jgi:hypothetical protein